MIINDDNDKLRRSPSPISPISSLSSSSPTSSSSSSRDRSRSPTTSVTSSTGYTQGRRSSHNSSRWSSIDQNDRASPNPTAFSNSGRRTSDAASIHSHGTSPQYQAYNRRNSSTLGYVHVDDEMYDDPPPQYSRFDENQYPHYQRPQPQPQSNRFSYTSNNYPRTPQTRHTAPPQYPSPRPTSTGVGDNGVTGGPPASVQANNGIHIDRDNDNVSGSYVVDPDRPRVSGIRENLKLSSKNGMIDTDVAVLPVKSTSGNADRVNLKFDSKCGAVKLRLHDAPKRFLPNNGAGNSFIPRNMIVEADSKNGLVHLCIPRSYKGILYLHTANGNIKLSPAVRASLTTLDSNDQLGTCRMFGIMGPPPDGLRDVQDALAAERVAHVAEEAEAPYSAPDISQILGSGVTRVMGPDGMTTYYSSGGHGMFNGISNMSITGGEFHNVGGSEHIIVNGQPIRRSGPYQSASNFSMTMRAPPQKRRLLSRILQNYQASFKGSSITASSKNGSVKVWYDDETMDEQPGGWKANNEDTPSGPRRANTVFIHSGTGGGYARFSGTFAGMGIPFMNVGDSTTFSWFG